MRSSVMSDTVCDGRVEAPSARARVALPCARERQTRKPKRKKDSFHGLSYFRARRRRRSTRAAANPSRPAIVASCTLVPFGSRARGRRTPSLCSRPFDDCASPAFEAGVCSPPRPGLASRCRPTGSPCRWGMLVHLLRDVADVRQLGLIGGRLQEEIGRHRRVRDVAADARDADVGPGHSGDESRDVRRRAPGRPSFPRHRRRPRRRRRPAGSPEWHRTAGLRSPRP